MSTTLTPSAKPFAKPPVILHATQRRLSVDEYHRMGELGVLTPQDRVELIHGLLVEKPVMTPPHAYAVTQLAKLLNRLVESKFEVRIQMPITLSESEPEPDVVVAALSASEYFDRHPSAQQVELLIEVALSSLAFDRGEKQALYAAHGVKQYWIVNLVDKRIETHSEPKAEDPPLYANIEHYPLGSKATVFLGGARVGEFTVSDVIK